jgi:GTP cyclohydrolase I
MCSGRSSKPNSSEMVLPEIEFHSTCEHQMLPFPGRRTSRICRRTKCGPSKLARLVEIYARRLQVENWSTRKIATELQRILQPNGARS